MYVYKITNEKTKEVYVGFTSDFGKRVGQHIRESRAERSGNRKLYKSMAEYGIENFCFAIVEETDDEGREKYWVEQYDSYNNGLNGTKDGKGNKIMGVDGKGPTKITNEMVELAKESYRRNHDLILASKISKIPKRKIKYILEQNGVTRKLYNSAKIPKKSESNKYDSKPFYMIDNKTQKIVNEYSCIKVFLRTRHISLDDILSRLDKGDNSTAQYIYKWK